jgi:hypothetical protein
MSKTTKAKTATRTLAGASPEDLRRITQEHLDRQWQVGQRLIAKAEELLSLPATVRETSPDGTVTHVRPAEVRPFLVATRSASRGFRLCGELLDRAEALEGGQAEPKPAQAESASSRHDPAATLALIELCPLTPIRSDEQLRAACAFRDELLKASPELKREEVLHLALLQDLIEAYHASQGRAGAASTAAVEARPTNSNRARRKRPSRAKRITTP